MRAHAPKYAPKQQALALVLRNIQHIRKYRSARRVIAPICETVTHFFVDGSPSLAEEEFQTKKPLKGTVLPPSLPFHNSF